MATRYFGMRNLKFLLFEVFNVLGISRHEYYKQYDKKSFDLVLQAATEFANKLLFPVFQEMDRDPPELTADGVRVHPSVKKLMREFGNGGWLSATIREDLGGQQLPHLISNSCQFIFAAANYSAFAYATLSTGAAHLLEASGTQEMLDAYLPKILSGEWQGTMALTEPEAGSSLADLTTMAILTDHGYYRIRGQKVFISAGDHDGVDNVVHMMLARIEGAPLGVRGISLFMVPQKRIGADGRLTSNDIVTSGIFHKLGYKGCPITQLSIGDKDECRGYLMGDPNKGLACMFQMMNEERIGVGLGAAAIATAAYYASLEYARQRTQGRKPSEKNPALPQIPLIEHADVKRMLLFQRAVTEGSLSLLLQCSEYLDMQEVCGEDEQEKYNLLLELLTPVAKSYPSEMGIVSISQGLQIFGGSGYCDDYPLEQYYRDARIHPIHEGTTGIHGIDLLGRKVIMKNGKAFALYLKEIGRTVEEAKTDLTLKPYAQLLSEALSSLERVTSHLTALLEEKGPEHFLADATLYLELFGIISIAWQWLLQGIAIQKALSSDSKETDLKFYQGKFGAFKYFFGYELPKISGLVQRLMCTDGLTVEMSAHLFGD